MESEQEFLKEIAKKRAFFQQLEQEHQMRMKKYLILLLEEYKHYPPIYLKYLQNDPFLSQLFNIYNNNDTIINNKNNIISQIIYNGENIINNLINALNKESNKDCDKIKEIIHFDDLLKSNNLNNIQNNIDNSFKYKNIK